MFLASFWPIIVPKTSIWSNSTIIWITWLIEAFHARLFCAMLIYKFMIPLISCSRNLLNFIGFIAINGSYFAVCCNKWKTQLISHSNTCVDTQAHNIVFLTDLQTKSKIQKQKCSTYVLMCSRKNKWFMIASPRFFFLLSHCLTFCLQVWWAFIVLSRTLKMHNNEVKHTQNMTYVRYYRYTKNHVLVHYL